MLNVRCWRSKQTPMLECGNAGFEPIADMSGPLFAALQRRDLLYPQGRWIWGHPDRKSTTT